MDITRFRKMVDDDAKKTGYLMIGDSIKTFVKESSGCIGCGERDECCLDYHHIDPRTKKFNMSKPNHGREAVWKEIEKCEIVCSNCHRKLHNYNWTVDQLVSHMRDRLR